MKKIGLSVCFLLFFIGVLSAQSVNTDKHKPQHKEKFSPEFHEQIKSYMGEVLTEHLVLSEKQQKEFLPLYYKYADKVRENSIEQKQLIRQMAVSADTEIDQLFKQLFALKEQEVTLEKKYHEDFKKVLSIRQLAELYHAENRIKNDLLRRTKQQGKE